jgi:hypothetical protein
MMRICGTFQYRLDLPKNVQPPQVLNEKARKGGDLHTPSPYPFLHRQHHSQDKGRHGQLHLDLIMRGQISVM